MKSKLSKSIIISLCVIAMGLILPVRSFATATPTTTWNVTYDSGDYDFSGLGTGGPGAGVVAVDSSGNVYVVGSSWRGSFTDTHTIKYNSAGGVVWNVADPAVTGRANTGAGVAVDASGNVYITGFTLDAGNANPDWRTIKYNSAGGIVWNVAYNSGIDDTASGIAVDASGNVYVTGTSGTGITAYDFRTIKYNSAGNIVWNVTYDSGGNDHSIGVAVDASGNVYVEGSDPNGIWRTIKYNSAGSILWNVTFSPGYHSTIVGPYGLAVDASGNVYVEGLEYSGVMGATWYARSIKYNSAGGVVWNNLYNSGGGNVDQGLAVAVDASGNSYVLGQTQIGSNVNMRTIKYDSTGAAVWNVVYDSGATLLDAPRGIAVDASGNVYVAGHSMGASNYNLRTIKYIIPACTGPLSFSFTDPALTAGTTPIRTVHVNELRADVNSLLTDAGTSTVSFTDPTLTAGTTPIRAVHINELRTALARVYQACGQAVPTYTDATLTGGSSLVRAIDISELRTKVLAAP